MHIFPFSQRSGTKAYLMPDQIEKSVKRKRAYIAIDTARKMSQAFKLSQIGKTVQVIFESEKDGHWVGHSGNYLEVCILTGAERNGIHHVQITGVENELVWGKIVSP